MAVRFTSPSPCAARESLVQTSAPQTNTGTCNVVPSWETPPISRHHLGTVAGFKSVRVAGFKLEDLAGFVGGRMAKELISDVLGVWSTPVLVGYSNPNVPMVKLTQDWQGEHVSYPLSVAGNRPVLLQR